ncbi:hypothetical protein CHS0354_000589 [Potamilus streckersoni]|uniref:PurM-like N-terminal domain-containing protein n=1 Tax=Potamilus streckersoni TaxID=2493646 RepID=A0AAE0T6U4_9BIVA|nr:hypothetical protein CHS0354_000589 [Potamilus streckersoni]
MTKISEIGEFGLIHEIKQIVDKNYQNYPYLQCGIGDDCAVIDGGNGVSQVITTDLLVEQIHFDLLTTPVSHLGYKSVSVNVSDIYAMNAVPKYATVSIGVSESISVEMIKEFYQGVFRASRGFSVPIVGGDTSASIAGFLISITVVGEQKSELVSYRNGTKEGDVLCVTGDLGRAYAGLKILMRERLQMLEDIKENNQNYHPVFEDYKTVIQKHLLPKARKDIIEEFAKYGIKPTSMIDISDGLASEIKHLCRNSNVGVLIHEIKIPVINDTKLIADLFADDTTTYALFGGEDYELLFTVGKDMISKIELMEDITIIGEIKSKEFGVKMLSLEHEYVDLLQRSGFDHFKSGTSNQKNNLDNED